MEELTELLPIVLRRIPPPEAARRDNPPAPPPRLALMYEFCPGVDMWVRELVLGRDRWIPPDPACNAVHKPNEILLTIRMATLDRIIIITQPFPQYTRWVQPMHLLH
jgi:hypothetical protein